MIIDKRHTFVLIILIATLFGCNSDDDSSTLRSEDDSSTLRSEQAQANIEEGTIALNEGNFNEALELIGIAEALSDSDSEPDSETQILLANAYAGRAGVSLESLTESLTGNYTDGTTKLAPSLSKIMGMVNYYDENEFNVRTNDTTKALELFVAQDIATLSDDDRATVASLATVNATQNITQILEGNHPALLSDEEIKTLIEDNFDTRADSLIKAASLALELKYELVTAMTATTDNITSVVLDVFLVDSGLSDLESSTLDKAAFTTFIQTFNDATN
jgi:hypothetical protein